MGIFRALPFPPAMNKTTARDLYLLNGFVSKPGKEKARVTWPMC
jgi:type III secretory pathway lipoprotein EscJ